MLTAPGLRAWTRWIYPTSTISHLDVDGAVAFTVDDGFCGLDNPSGCMLDEVRKLFAEYDARATFFVTGSHCEHTQPAAVARLLADGHELANHGMEDFPYHRCSREAFAADLDATEASLQRFRAEPSPFYRAPFGRLSAPMQAELSARGLQHAVCDAFAHDTAIPDPAWISRTVLRACRPGSIALIHMPERGCREWNYEAMRRTLAGLRDRGLDVVTLRELAQRRRASRPK